MEWEEEELVEMPNVDEDEEEEDAVGLFHGDLKCSLEHVVVDRGEWVARGRNSWTPRSDLLAAKMRCEPRLDQV